MNPRNDESILQLTDEDKVNTYADAMILRDRVRGYPSRRPGALPEPSTDNRAIGSDYAKEKDER